MRIAIFFSCSILYTICPLVLYAQKKPDGDINLERLVDEIFPLQGADSNYDELYENIALRLSNPIDLNTATEEQLRSLFILNEKQIKSFMSYREKQHHLLSLYELQVIPDFDVNTINTIKNLVTVYPLAHQSFRLMLKRILHEKNNYLLVRVARTLEKKQGYSTDSAHAPAYAGSPYQIYTRFRVARSNDFSLGFTLEKDAGEPFMWKPEKRWLGFDYASMHMQIRNKGILNNLIIGDYRAQFGQGILLGDGFGAGKGAEPITTVRRSNIGFIPHTSLNESGFFRGVALSISPVKRITINGFFSYKKQDGSIMENDPETGLSSIASTGLHRTITERQNKASVNELNYGTIITYKKNRLEAGAIAHGTILSIPLIKTPRPYNQFAFNGDRNTNVGLFLNYNWNNISFFGEISTSMQQGIAYIAGLACSLSARFDLALLHRRYDRNFYTFYGNAFAESTLPQNETGYYIGYKYTLSHRYAFAGYIDFFQFPWLRYGGYAPSSGREWLVRLSGSPSKSLSFYLQARGESKIGNLPGTTLFSTQNGIKNNYWINCDYAISPQIKLRSRIQYSTYQLDKKYTKGFAIIQDIRYTIGKFSTSLRHAFFDTDDYKNRQYVYEQNVWLAYSMPAYHGVGVRNYILLQYKPNRHFTFWIRWAHTLYTDRSHISAGNERIEKNSKNDITFQARIKL